MLNELGYIAKKKSKAIFKNCFLLYLLGASPRLRENCKDVGVWCCYVFLNHKGRVEIQINNRQLLYKFILNMALFVVYLKFKFNLAFCILLVNCGRTAPFDTKRTT